MPITSLDPVKTILEMLLALITGASSDSKTIPMRPMLFGETAFITLREYWLPKLLGAPPLRPTMPKSDRLMELLTIWLKLLPLAPTPLPIAGPLMHTPPCVVVLLLPTRLQLITWLNTAASPPVVVVSATTKLESDALVLVIVRSRVAVTRGQIMLSVLLLLPLRVT